LSKALPTQALATPPNEKSVVVSDIATILGLLQHFSGVETWSKFSSSTGYEKKRNECKTLQKELKALK
jgi:hypothetical protein